MSSSIIVDRHAAQLVARCHHYLRSGASETLRAVLSSRELQASATFWTALLSDPSAGTRSVVQGIVGTLLLAVRDGLNDVKAARFDHESQFEATDAANPENVVRLDTQPSEGGNSGSDGAPLTGLLLYALLQPCRRPRTCGQSDVPELRAADDAVEEVMTAMECDQRATVNLSALARSLQLAGALQRRHTVVQNDADDATPAPDTPRTDLQMALSDALSMVTAFAGQVATTRRARDSTGATDEQMKRAQPQSTPADIGLPVGGKPGTIREATSFDDIDLPAAAHCAMQGTTRLRVPFTQAEDNAILAGVARFSGHNRFNDIFRHYAAAEGGSVWHPSRTTTHIADHYRQVLRRRRLADGR